MRRAPPTPGPFVDATCSAVSSTNTQEQPHESWVSVPFRAPRQTAVGGRHGDLPLPGTERLPRPSRRDFHGPRETAGREALALLPAVSSYSSPRDRARACL